MVKEVEFQNIAETVKVGDQYVPYTTTPNLDMFSGFLSDMGKLLTVDVNREIPTAYARQVSLYFANIDFSYSKLSYVKLKSTDLLTNDPAISYVGSSHKFDLSPVLAVPQRESVMMPINDLTIDLFTYEANVTEPDGTSIYQKRLSVPYKAVSDSSTKFAQSTDGWYVLGVVDYAIRKYGEPTMKEFFRKGDIVYWYENVMDTGLTNEPSVALGDLWIADQDTDGFSKEYWSLPTEEQLLNFVLIPKPSAVTKCATIVHTDILISRYVKQYYILKTLVRTSFKDYDDSTAWYVSDMLSSMRELALDYLQKGDGTKAKYMLDKISNEYMAIMTGKKNYEATTISLNYTT